MLELERGDRIATVAFLVIPGHPAAPKSHNQHHKLTLGQFLTACRDGRPLAGSEMLHHLSRPFHVEDYVAYDGPILLEVFRGGGDKHAKWLTGGHCQPHSLIRAWMQWTVSPECQGTLAAPTCSFQTPPDLVVKLQCVDILGVILWLVLRLPVVYSREIKSRSALTICGDPSASVIASAT